MPHTLIIGITGSGKTTLAKRLAIRYANQGIPVLVLDPFKSPEWQANLITDEPDEFVDIVFENLNCAIFVDESADMIGRWAGTMQKLATQSRNLGHNVHFICQRPKQLDINMRTQCESIFVFKLSYHDAKELAIEFVANELSNSAGLLKGEFICKIGIDGMVSRGKIF